MLTTGTLAKAGLQAAGAARIGGHAACHGAAAMNLTRVWSISEYAAKPATSTVFHTDRPARRPGELSP